MRYLLTILFVLLSFVGFTQTFTYSGYIYTASGSPAINVPVKIYKRTTPSLTGFTSQQNYNGHSYYRSTGTAFWTDARAACTNMGGYLVTITSSAENNFIFGIWPSGWIGLTDEVTEGIWRWVTGEAYSYSSWNPGEPNNSGNEDYVQFVGGGRWNDLPNGYSLPYVLEFDYIVTFTPWVLVTTVYTNSLGYYVYSGATNPSIEWYAEINAVNPTSALSNTDITTICNVVNRRTVFNGIHYYMYDVNNDGKVTISDAYYVNARRWSIFNSWVDISNSMLLTSAQYNAIKATTANLETTYPGVSSIVTSTMTSSTTANYYIISPGYSGIVNY
jgi:hypothetical protein